jgi:adenine-specific DNA methylase
MSEKSEQETEYKSIKSETILPTKTVGLECLKEANPETMSPHRNIFKWFARRPTAASRLAILSSVLSSETSNEELLNLMGVGPRWEIDNSISDFVLEKFATKDDRKGTIEEHFGYEYPHRNVPSESELQEFHEKLRSRWDGELPTVLDPTAGGGTIPLESLRYGLPTISNELNPVAWLINKVILQYAPSVGSIEQDVTKWMEKIEESVEKELDGLFPSKNGISPDHYFRGYSFTCSSCGNPIPISNQWYFNRRRNAAVYPEIIDGELSFRIIDPSNTETRDNYNPSEGTVDGGDVECPSCGVVTERSETVKRFKQEEFEYEVYGVRYEKKINGTKYHSPRQEDIKAIREAKDRVESDLTLSTLLTTERYEGYYDRAIPYGLTQWRDVYSPRQLASHAAYLKGFNEVKPDIVDNYSEEKAKLILSVLSFISVKLIQRNSRLNAITPDYGSPNDMLGNNGYFFKWSFGESNLMTGTYSYQSEADNIIDGYEQTAQYVEHTTNTSTVSQQDASDLSIDDDSIQSVVIDPPYGDNIMYAEMADAFQVWFHEYLGDVFPDEFSSPETNKQDEAVENPVIVNPKEGQSTSDAARQRYENRMSEIFSELYRVIEPGGVLTIYFTDKEVNAWDSLTMSIIRSEFNITATHTITSEIPNRIVAQQNASADSTLLLTCRKPTTKPSNRTPTLWRDIKNKTRRVARKKATELLDSDYNLTKTDMIISAFGPTLRVFTEQYPVVDDKDNPVRPKKALTEARTAVTEVLIERELSGDLENVDSLTTWYVLSWMVYESQSVPYDEARQLGLGVGVQIDEIKQETKIWSKSKDSLVIKGSDYRVQDYDSLESGAKRRARACPINPQDQKFENDIDAVHATLNVLKTKGSDFTWNWIKERDLHNSSRFVDTVSSLIQVLPNEHSDYDLLINLTSGKTGELLDIEASAVSSNQEESNRRTTLEDF